MPYLIDGDNLLWVWELEGDIEERRSKLLNIILKFQKKKKSKFVVFFDGPLKKEFPQNENLKLVISERGVSADELIKEMLDPLHDCKNFILVSSDRELRYQAKIKRARLINSLEFKKILLKAAGKTKCEDKEFEPSSLEIKLWENLFKKKKNDYKKKKQRNG